MLIIVSRGRSPGTSGRRPTKIKICLKLPLLAILVGGGYFFRFKPREIAAITSISNEIVSITLMGDPPFGVDPALSTAIAYHIIPAKSIHFCK
jgi:hypothetical protein